MQRPNILLLTTDQQRWDALGVNGNADIRTPNLDALAREGVNLDHFFVQNPVCMPSRMSTLTGLYPSSLGIVDNGTALPAGAITLPRMLRTYGYLSANIGKLHFLPHANRDHRQAHPVYGFDHLEISDEPGCYEDAYRAWVRLRAPGEMDRISLGLPPATRAWQRIMGIDDGIVHADRDERKPIAFAAPSGLTHSAFVAEQTIEFLRARRGGPFLCIAGFYSPHSPWVAPREFLDLYDPAGLTLPEFPPEVDRAAAGADFSDDALRAARQGYYAQVSEVDHHVGRILNCLAEVGLAERTIVVFTSDHGEWLGEHLRYGKGYPAHDCIGRVPCVVHYSPGGAAGGRRVSALAEAVDLIPTLLRWAGIPIPPHLQGRPLPMDDAGTQPRTSVLTEGHGWKTLRTDRHRYVLHADGREMLYDLGRPFGEYRDLAGEASRTGVLSDLRKELARRLIAIERPLPREWAY